MVGLAEQLSTNNLLRGTLRGSCYHFSSSALGGEVLDLIFFNHLHLNGTMEACCQKQELLAIQWRTNVFKV